MAIVLVMLFHAGQVIPGGYVGVDAFFVISGFVIAGSISSQVTSGTFSPVDFLLRRVRRLVPALFLMLVVVMVLASWLVTYGALQQTLRTGLSASLSLANVYLYRFRPRGYFEVEEKQNALLHTWSLSLEEQFFIALALVVGVVTYFARNNARLRMGLLWCLGVVLGVSSLATCLWLAMFPVEQVPSWADKFVGPTKLASEFSFFMPFTRAWQFLMGVLIAVAPRLTLRKMGRIPAFVGLGLVAVSAFSFGSLTTYPGFHALAPTIGTALLIASGERVGLLRRLLSSTPALWIGDRSYSLYLWHWPLILFATPFFPDSRTALLVAAAVSLVPAMFSYRYVESPIRRIEMWAARSRLSIMTASSVALVVVVFQLSTNPAPELDAHLDRTIGCEVGAEQHLDPSGTCSLSVKDADGHAVLLGDSHAGMLSEAFVDAAHDNAFNAVLAVEAGAPFIAPVWDAEAVASSSTMRVIERIVQQRPRVVVFAQSTWPLPPQAGPVTWLEAFRPILERLRDARIPVVLASTTYFPYGDPSACSHLQTLLEKCSADRSFDIDSEIDAVDTKVAAERSLAEEFDNVAHFDIAPIVCPGKSCDTRRDGKWWWRDRTHISVYASELLGPSLNRAMDSAIEETTSS
jgi:peptidoglycan/LPS O-acetylase OafA/YrhL